MVCTINLKAIMRTNVRTGCIIIWTILVITSAHTEKKYETVRDQENFDTFNSSHTIILGHRQDGDRFIFSHLTDCDRRWFRVTTTDFIYPGGPLQDLNATISCIRVTDIGYPSKGRGFVIKNGGIGHTSLIIQFTSLWNKAMKYFIEVFGIYPKMNITRHVTLAWYMPTNNKKVVKLMRRFLIATSRHDGSPIFSPMKLHYLKSLANRPVTLPDGRPYYVRKYSKVRQNKLVIPRVVNYKTFYRTSYKPVLTLYPKRFVTFRAMQPPNNVMNQWGKFARKTYFEDFYKPVPPPVIIELPTTVKTTTDCMRVFDYKKH